MRETVQAELDRRGMGGGGGDDRIVALEKEVAIIKATMVTAASLECEAGKLRTSMESEFGKMRLSIQNVPLTLLKWLGSTIGVIGVVVAIVVGIMRLAGKSS